MSIKIKQLRELINPEASVSQQIKEKIYPITHEKAVVDDNGNTLDNKLAAITEETLEENREMVNSVLENYAPIEIIGDVTNAPDEEDLTSVNVEGTDVLKFKDKVYNPLTYSGMGRKILRKNIVDGVNTLTQSMINQPNTIYVIQYDFTLGENITVPANCVLEFDGGCLSNGTLNFNSTKIVSPKKCFDTDITFAGNIINDEVLISWFVNASNTMESNRDFKYDCHDVIINAMKLTSCIRGNITRQQQGWLNLEKIPLAVLTPIVINGDWGAIGIKKANISFCSSADGQSLFKYVYDGDVWYSAFEDCVFMYKGTTEETDQDWHEMVSCIEYDTWWPYAYDYWRDIQAFYWTGYFMVNKCYLQMVTFENIKVNSQGGFITYNGEEYYGNKKGSSNIIHLLNCNINQGVETAKYEAKCKVPYLWSFCNYMELTIKNTVSQGKGLEGQTILWLGGGYYPQTCILDGFWVEYVSGKLDSRARISGNCSLHLYKGNISGFYTVGNHENINIYDHSVSSEFFNGSSFVDRSEINENTNRVAIFYNNTVYSNAFNLSNKFQDWMDKGIIRTIELLNYPLGNNYKGPAINIYTSETFDVKQILISSLYRNKLRDGSTTYLSEYNGIPTLVIENNIGWSVYHAAFPIQSNSYNKCGEVAELIYRITVLVDVTEDNKDNVYVKDSWLAGVGGNMFTPEVGTMAGTSTKWLRRICVRNSSTYNPLLTGSVSGCKLEIAYNVIKGQTALRDYDDIIYNAGTQEITRKPYPKKELYIAESAGVKLDDMLSLIGTCTSPVRTDDNVIQKDSNGAVHTQYPVKGTTANRPTVLTSVDKGFNYFDTTINKSIYWNGTAWIDATGTTV